MIKLFYLLDLALALLAICKIYSFQRLKSKFTPGLLFFEITATLLLLLIFKRQVTSASEMKRVFFRYCKNVENFAAAVIFFKGNRLVAKKHI